MEGKTVVEVLTAASNEDLSILADIITDNGKGRLALDAEIRAKICTAKTYSEMHSVIELLDKEISLFGGNTLVNVFRKNGVSYAEIVADVASHLKVKFNKGDSVVEIEGKILEKIFADAIEKMSPDELAALITELNGGKTVGVGQATVAAIQALIRAGGFGPYRIAVIVANVLAKQLTGKGLSFAANSGITRLLGGFAGPVGWVLTGIWTLYDVSTPAYRVTIPAVVMVAYMRQRQMQEAKSNGDQFADEVLACL